MAITIDIPDGKALTVTGPGQVVLKTQTPDQVELSDPPVIDQMVVIAKIEK